MHFLSGDETIMRKPISFIPLLLLALLLSSFTHILRPGDMTKNKETVARYMSAFNQKDHAAILACLTENVVWELPGVYQHRGKAAFDKEIENEGFSGKPVIKVSRMVEENNVVIAEGTVQATTKDGVVVNLVFCDVFEMENGLIKKLISYLMPIPDKK